VIQTISSSIGKKSPKSCFNWQIVAKWLACGVFALTVVNVPSIAIAVSIENVPNPKQVQGGWVTDMANILSPETEAKINTTLSKLAATNGSEIAVVTVTKTSPSATPKDFATDLFNYWGIGKKGKDNGVLVLISKGDRRVEIETGYGVEDVLPDALVGNIINQKITPQFKQGNFDKGTLVGTQALVAVLERQVSNTNSLNSSQIEQSNRSNWQVLYWLLGLGGMIGGVGIYVKYRATQKAAEVLVKPCPTCQQSMTKVDATVLEPMLNQPQQVAQELGSVEFEAWHCTNCHPQINSLKEINLSRNVCYQSNFRNCPICREMTVQRTSKVLQPATVESVGKRLVIDTCHCCSYQQETEQTINRLPPPPPPPSRSIWTNSSGTSSSTSNWSSGSSGGYSGGGDWGGGSSGGGGAGGSW